MEIGSGTGTSTAAMAPKEADTNIIAVELYKPGLAKLLGQIEREGIDNIRMIRGDGIEVMVRMFAPESLDGIRVFFPDPGQRPATTSAASSSRAHSTFCLPPEEGRRAARCYRPRRIRRVDR